MQTTRTSGAKALYHALLAQSAYHVANLKGAQLGAQERASAIRHYGTALHELRHSLIEPSKDYTTVLAALYTIILAEHVFQGTASGWQGHIRGARAVVYDYLEQKPWGKSQEAYIVTQNFALSVLISSTVDDKFLATERADGVNELDGLLHDLMVRPVFGYTIGGTPHMLRALYQTRLLEAQIKAKGDTDTDGPPEPDADMFGRVGEILQLSYIPLADKVDSYVTHRKHSGVTVLPRMRTLTLLHLRLFNTAIIIYLFCVVLRCPPSSMAQDVLQVLRDGTTFSEMQNGTVSVWPVFVAAAEAYTPEARALATHCLDMSLALGVANLRDILRVINQSVAGPETIGVDTQHYAVLTAKEKGVGDWRFKAGISPVALPISTLAAEHSAVPGLGAVICEKFAAQGAAVAVSYVNNKERADQVAEKCRQQYGVEVVTFQADIGNREDIARLVKETVEQLGGLDIIINNAGWTRFATFGDLNALSHEDWNKCWDINVMSHLSLMQHAAPIFNNSADGGTIIYGSSMAYCVTKAAGLRMMKCLASTQGPKIRVNAVLPGLLLTEWVR
ncbi:hypothetical protein KCU88_g5830, partial [Aureobasidium melanogenum]